MKPERWQKIDEIFHAALQYKPDERQAFIEKACRGDEELRRELESLLAEERGADQFIEEPAMEAVAKDLADEQKDASDRQKNRPLQDPFPAGGGRNGRGLSGRG